ncbi:MAG: cell surface protein SprA [Chitinispirillaceae bacterium]
MRNRIVKLSILLFCLSVPLLSQGLKYESPRIEGFHSPFEPSYGSPLTDPHPRLLKRRDMKLFSDTTIIDFEKRQLTFLRQDSQGNAVWTYHYGEMNDYILAGRNHSFINKWYEELTSDEKKAVTDRSQPKLQWELAVHYPPWAQRLLGNQPPSLTISGNLEITIGFENIETMVDGELMSDQSQSSGLVFENDYQFGISGSVGRLININITHNRNSGFDLAEDPLKNFKIEYKESTPGELEDEIIQEITAGYTDFNMPGTDLSGYSQKTDGLFGIKVRSKFGPLMLTTIASHAQGEAITKELGGGNDPNSNRSISELEIEENRYFFLDTLYRRAYNRKYNLQNPDISVDPPQVQQLQVFRQIQARKGGVNTKIYKGKVGGSEVDFELLRRDEHYYLEPGEGWIRFHDTVRISDNEKLAITMRTADGSIEKGTYVSPASSSDSAHSLWQLKPDGMNRMESGDDPSFGLMWRNVYHLSDFTDAQGFKIDVFYMDPNNSDDTLRQNSENELLTDVLGLTVDGKPRLDRKDIFDTENGYLILPPHDPSFQGNEPFANPALGDMADSTIYNYGRSTSEIGDYKTKFGMRMSGTSKQTTFDDLGWGIMEGTVVVKTKSGKVLKEKEDYLLDYQMGVLELISPEAKAAESIVVTYQRESDFAMEKKVFAGMRGEVMLPFISEKSFAAMNLLYQDVASSSNDVPQLQNEPYSKLHLSFNTRLDFKPDWMTDAVDLLPLVRTTRPSSAKFDMEVVHSRMNPNTTREASAYLDDFERSKESHSLSLSHSMWHPSHFPFEKDSIVNRPPVWDFYWFRPISNDSLNKVNRYSIWKKDPNKTRITSSENTIDILRLHATPGHPEYARRFEDAYASITTPFYRNGLDLDNARYFDLLIRPDGARAGSKGKLTIQIGTFNEDQVRNGGPPNGMYDFEDTLLEKDYSKLDLLDKGLDGVRDEDEFHLIPNEDGTGWDTLFYGDPRLKDPEDPSGDNYKEYGRDHVGNFKYANRTEKNKAYDTEDINGDGIPQITQKEEYYSYTIDLDSADVEYIDRSARLVEGSGWRFYRIPLKEVVEGLIRDSVNSPDWRKMGGVRLVWHDFDEQNITREHKLLIAEMEIVGNEWETVAADDSTAENKIEASNISNKEDSVYFNSVYDRFVERKAGEETEEENSLRLRFFDLLPGDTALARKTLNAFPQDITGYDSLSLQVHGDVSYGDDLEFVFRFGTDDSTFYEYSGPVKSGWNNRILISLQELSDLKLRADQNNQPIDTSSADGHLRIVAPANKRPNFSSIRYMATGVIRDENASLTPLEGELWVNELKAVGSRKLNGWAARTDLSTQWADLMSFSTGMNYTEGDFRTMTQDVAGGTGSSKLSANVNASAKLDKFLPKSWGVSIPVGGSVSGSVSRPNIKPNSDVFLFDDNGSPDNIMDMASDAANMMLGRDVNKDTTRAERFQTFSETRNAYASFSKNRASENPLVNLTVDRISTDLNYNQTETETGKGPHENPDSADYLRTDINTSYSGNLKYDLSPRNPPNWTKWKPFDKVEWIPQLYKNYGFNLLPSTLSFDLADVRHRVSQQYDPKLGVDYDNQTFDLRHGMKVEYSPINPLVKLSYSLNIDRDLSTMTSGISGTDAWLDFIADSVLTNDDAWSEYWILRGENRRTQSASVSLEPQFFDWLTHSANYSADYTGARVSRGSDSTDYLNASVRTSLRFRNTFHFNDFFKKNSDLPAVGKLLGWLGKGVQKFGFRSVNFDYDITNDLTNSYLSSTFLSDQDSADLESWEFLKYQLGLGRSLEDRFGARVDEDGFGGMAYRKDKDVAEELYKNDQITGNWSATVSTGFNLPDPFRINIPNVSVGWGKEFRAKPDSGYIDTTMVLPEIRVNANTSILEKFPLVQKNASRFKLTSSMSYKETEKQLRDRTDLTEKLDFSPLLGIEGRVKKWPVNFSYRYRNSRDINLSNGKDDRNGSFSTDTTRRNSHNFTLSYEISKIKGLQEIRLFKWVIPIRGKTRMGLNVSQDKTLRTKQYGRNELKKEEAPESQLRYTPYIEYEFTKNVDGEFKFTGSRRSSGGVDTNKHLFAIIVRVKF